MSNPIPSSLALAVIANGQPGDATPIANNYSQIQAAVNALITALSGGAAGQVLQAVDGTNVQYVVAGTTIASGKKTSNVTTTGTTFAAGADLLPSALSFTADGLNSYEIEVSARSWNNTLSATTIEANLNIDGADGGLIATTPITTAGNGPPLLARTVVTPTAGTHTVNIRVFAAVGGGTLTVVGGAGGAATDVPIFVTIRKV